MSSTRTELEKVTLEKDIGEQLRGVTINQNITTNTVLEPDNIALTGQKKKLEKSQSKTEEKTIPQIGGLPQYTIQLDSDIDKHYEKQIVGSNNCFAITAATLYNQHLKNRAGTKTVSNDELLNQYDVRGYKPKIVSKDEYKKHGINNADLTYDSDSAELREFARLDSKTMGNIFSLSDLFLQLDNDVCVKNMTLTTANLDEAARHDMYELFLNSLSKALLKKEAVGLYTSSDRHYITVVGVERENIKYLDSSSENPNEIKTKHLTQVFFGEGCTVEMTWLEEIEKEVNISAANDYEKKPVDLSRKYKRLSKDGDDYVYTHANQQGEQVEAAAENNSYINDSGLNYGVAVVLTDEEKKNQESVSDPILKNVEYAVYVPKNSNTPKLDLAEYRHSQSAERADAIRILNANERRILEGRDENFDQSVGSEQELKALKTPVIGDLNTKSFNLAVSFFTANNTTGKSETFVALRRALIKANAPANRKQGEEFTQDKSSLLDQLQHGEFHLTDENYATFLDLYQAVSAYVVDHVSSWSTDSQQRYDKACEMKAMLDYVARESVRRNTGEMNEPALSFTIEEKKTAIKNVDRQLEYYIEYSKKTDKNPMLSSDEKLIRKWDALKVFERDVQIYIHAAETEAARKNKQLKGNTYYLVQEYRSLKQQMKLRDLASNSGFVKAFTNETTDLIREHSYSLYDQGLKKQRQRTSSMDGDDGLNAKQIQNMNMIDQWVVRNVRNRNIASPFSQENRADIAAKLLSMPRRKRLYIYYLVETRERVNPTPEGFFMSQTSSLYTPKLEGFKKQMIATRWKFYKRISRDHIYWDKLTQAMMTADKITPLINQVSKYMKATDPLESEKKENKEETSERETEIVTTSKDAAQKDKAVSDVEKARLETKDCLIRFARNGQKAMQVMRLKESAKGKDKEEKEKELIKLQEEANDIILKMCSSAEKVTETPGKSLEASEMKDTKLHYVNTFSPDAQKVLTIAGNALNDATVFGAIAHSKAELEQLTRGYSQGLGTIGGIAAAVGAVFAMAAIIDNPDPVTEWDIAATVMALGNGVAKATANVAALANTITSFSDVLTAAAPTFAVVFAGMETVNAVVKTGSAARNGYHRSKASKLYNKRMAELEKSGKRIEADKYRDGMLRLNEKLSQREAVASTGAVFTAGASLTAAALLLAGVISVGTTAIVGGVTLVATLAARSVSREYSKSMKVELFDAYFEIPELYEKVKAQWIKKNDGRIPTADQEKAMLKSLRERVSAERGFFSPAHAAAYIADRYAKHMLQRAHSGEADSGMYIQLIKGLGLRYEYDKASGLEIPTASDIVNKLCR